MPGNKPRGWLAGLDLSGPRTFLLFAALGIVALYAMPAASGPECPVHLVAGIKCPGCGALRACHALLRGDVNTAWAMNPALVVTIAVTPLVVFAIYLARRRASAQTLGRLVQAVAIGFLVLSVLWTIARNVWVLDAA
jgi:hypothetical protein